MPAPLPRATGPDPLAPASRRHAVDSPAADPATTEALPPPAQQTREPRPSLTTDGPAPTDEPLVDRVGGPRGRPGTGRQTLVTFDVFETVLVRAVSPAAAVFDLVGERAGAEGLVECSPQAFSRARESADRRAGRRHRDAMTLADIYVEVGGALGLDEAAQARLAQLEIEVETEQLHAVESVRPVLASERAAAGRIVYVSDMYLPAEVIRSQLERHGFWEEGDVLYVSHTHGRTKRSGALFHLVAETEGVDIRRIRHLGNDHRADVRGARRAGAAPVMLTAGNPNRYEAALQRHRHATDGLTASMAGASRLARTGAGATTEREQALVDVAAGVMAPVLVGYVTWVLRRAEALGLQRLYFVARDGQVLLRIAERLAPRLGITTELRYLYASRLVWNRVVASPSRNPQVWHSLIGLSSDGVTSRDILERTGIGHDVVERVVAASPDPGAWTSTTDRTALNRALTELEADGTLAAASEANRRVVLRYLQEQGLLDGGLHGFVDVGWRGTQHDVLAELQQDVGVPPAHGLFFGLDRSTSDWGHLREAYFFDTRYPAAEGGDLLALGGDYLPGARTPGGTPIGLAQFALVEVFCSGDHGTLTDYEETPEGVRPVLTTGREEAVRRWGLPLVWRTVDAYVDHLATDAGRPYRHVDVHQALSDVMRLFWEWPTPAEVRAWADFPWEVGQGRRQRFVELARRYRLTDVLTAATSGPPSLRHLKQAVRRAQRSEWVAASVVQSSPLAALALRPRATLRQGVGRTTDRARAELARRPRLRRLLGG